MLQNNSAVVNLQYDSDLRIAQHNRVEPICKVLYMISFVFNIF